MKDRRFRLLYLPENQSEMREFFISRNRMVFFGVAVLGLLLILTTVIGVLFSSYTGDERLAALQAENQILKGQVSETTDRIRDLMKQVDIIRERDSELRLVNNLPEVEEILKDAGIGGSDLGFRYNPDLLSAESEDLVRTNLENLDKLESSIKLEMQSYADLTEKINSRASKLSYIPSICPIKKGGRVTDRFGVRRSFRGWKAHTGLDIAARWGTPVYATADGVVESVTWRGGYGKTVIIDHGGGVKTLYGHLSAYNVRRGDKVNRNDKIAEVGSTGLSTGPHLHYEVRVNSVVQNPELYIFFDMVDYLEVR